MFCHLSSLHLPINKGEKYQQAVCGFVENHSQQKEYKHRCIMAAARVENRS